MPTYNPHPLYPPATGEVTAGIEEAIRREARRATAGVVLAIDGPMYLDWDDLIEQVRGELIGNAPFVHLLDTRDVFVPWDELQQLTLTKELAQDPDFAKLPDLSIAALLPTLPKPVAEAGQAWIVYGPGAALADPDHLWYADLPKRYAEAGVSQGIGRNLGQPEEETPTLKRLFYIDWPLQDQHRDSIAARIDRFIDASPGQDGVSSYHSISGENLRATLTKLASRPFRTRPTFNTTSWGGHWAQQELGMNPDAESTALGYELIAPESGLLIGKDEHTVEVPFQMLVAQQPLDIMGAATHEQFGTSFPIRFDYLDTVNGGNLSVHCHPQADYMREVFGWPYTQHETYYMMVGGEDRKVFLGLKQDADIEAFHAQADAAHEQGVEFDIEKYVQTFPATAHQLFVIPAGTPHGSGEGNVVLEVSATPYLYSLRFFDWLRRDSQGQQRPVHVSKAFANLNTNRTGKQVADDLVQQPWELRVDDGLVEEMLGSLPEMFFEVRRIVITSDEPTEHATRDRFHVFNVVEGDGVEVSWEGGSQVFAYAETFVVPAAVGRYSLRRTGDQRVRLVKALTE